MGKSEEKILNSENINQLYAFSARNAQLDIRGQKTEVR
jgi:hypothetical protein